jgi:hypothetical protein
MRNPVHVAVHHSSAELHHVEPRVTLVEVSAGGLDDLIEELAAAAELEDEVDVPVRLVVLHVAQPDDVRVCRQPAHIVNLRLDACAAVDRELAEVDALHGGKGSRVGARVKRSGRRIDLPRQEDFPRAAPTKDVDQDVVVVRGVRHRHWSSRVH